MNQDTELFFDIFHSIDFEKIKDHPNILIAANFWEEDRYQAARICYKFMRSLDDLIDNHKAKHRFISASERTLFTDEINKRFKTLYKPLKNNHFYIELKNTVKKFKIPLSLLEDFSRSMIFDINNNGFENLQSFVEYSKGASVAPAAVFVHLAGLGKNGDRYIQPPFDVITAATPCAMFSYIVHIIRDFRKDQLNNLNYFAYDMLIKKNLTPEDLYRVAQGTEIPDEFRQMMSEYYLLADKYRIETEQVLKNICPMIDIRYKLSLEIIFDLYLMVFERINIRNGSFTALELNPTPSETKERVFNKISKFIESI